MKDILTEIVKHKQEEVRQQKEVYSLTAIQEMLSQQEPRRNRSMKQSLAQSASGIIAEFKRRSPSKGWIKQDADVETIVASYEQAGAAATSILTDLTYFGGSLKDILNARPHVDIPILRKDFVIDGYQLYQAKLCGADAVLLIAACLSKEQCTDLTGLAHELGLEVLLEVHTPEEISYVSAQTDMLGVNNRNLGSFVTDTRNSFTLAEALRQATERMGAAPLLVSESGISSPDTIKELRKAGYRGFLLGEAFMRTESPGNTLREFVRKLS